MNARRLLALAATLAMLVGVLAIQAGAVVISDIDFEIDGNTAAGDDTPGGDDWESVIYGDEWDDGPATLIQDGNSGPKAPAGFPEENIFAKGGKFGDPAGWTIEPGNVPAQNDLTNVYVHAYGPDDSASGDSWIVMGMHRIKKQGTFDLDFEFNQVKWDGTSGTLVRTEGDIVVGFELSGNPEDPEADLQVLILYYAPDDTDCTGESFFTGVYGAGFCEVFRGSAATLTSYGAGTMNAVAFDPPPWGAFDSDGSVLAESDQVEPFYFAEAAINLSEFGIDLACPGFGSVHAKSRSSLEVTADMKDLAGPQDFPASCYIEGYKFHDLDADGTWETGEPGLDGWTIELYEFDEDSSAFVKVTETATAVDPLGYYRFGNLSDGTYRTVEVCPANWLQSYPGFSGECGTVTSGDLVINYSNQTASADFGNYQNVPLSGMKFKDVDADGLNDSEPGLAGWMIRVYEDVDNDGLDSDDSLAFYTPAGTPADGAFGFSLTPGKHYIMCEVGQTNWMQTAPDNTICSSDPFSEGLEPGGYAFTVASGQTPLTAEDFGNAPLSGIDVSFYDLTGSTNATITCVDSGDNPVGSSVTNEVETPETTVTAGGLAIGTYTCTITITDP